MTWFRKGRNKEYSTGEGSATLSFSSVSRSDAGQYRCKANNTAGTDETGALSLVVHCKYKHKQEVIFTCLNGQRESCIYFKYLMYHNIKSGNDSSIVWYVIFDKMSFSPNFTV